MTTPADTVAQRRHIANLRRKLALIRHHAAQRGPDGRSLQAVRAGHIGGRKRADSYPGGPRAFGLELALRRWYPDGEPVP